MKINQFLIITGLLVVNLLDIPNGEMQKSIIALIASVLIAFGMVISIIRFFEEE